MPETLQRPTATGANSFCPARTEWKGANPPDFKGLGYAVDAVLVPDTEDGGYTAYIAQLPGVHSQGDDAASAMLNIIEAFRAVIATYTKDGMDIPWRKPPEKAPDEDWYRITS